MDLLPVVVPLENRITEIDPDLRPQSVTALAPYPHTVYQKNPHPRISEAYWSRSF